MKAKASQTITSEAAANEVAPGTANLSQAVSSQATPEAAANQSNQITQPATNKKPKAAKPVGRPRAYTPEAFLQKAQEYIQYTQETPYEVYVSVRGEAKPIPKKYPVNVYDFCFFARIHRDTYYGYRRQKEYFEAFTLIDTYIKAAQYSGAMIGEFNSTFVARINELAENVNNHITGEQVIKVKFKE